MLRLILFIMINIRTLANHADGRMNHKHVSKLLLRKTVDRSNGHASKSQTNYVDETNFWARVMGESVPISKFSKISKIGKSPKSPRSPKNGGSPKSPRSPKNGDKSPKAKTVLSAQTVLSVAQPTSQQKKKDPNDKQKKKDPDDSPSDSSKPKPTLLSGAAKKDDDPKDPPSDSSKPKPKTLLSDAAEEDGADDLFTLGEPKYFGSGCGAKSVKVEPSLDESELSILFSEFSVKTSDSELDVQKSCHLAVPINTKDKAIGIARVEYRGDTEIASSSGGSTSFSAEYFFAGEKGPVSTSNFEESESPFLLTDDVDSSSIAWAPCDTSTVLRINTLITASKDVSGNGDAKISVDDGASVQGSFRYKLKQKDC